MSRFAGVRQLIAAALFNICMRRVDLWRDRAARAERWERGE